MEKVFTELKEIKKVGLTNEEIRLKCLELALNCQSGFHDKAIPLAMKFLEFVLGESCKQPDGTREKD